MSDIVEEYESEIAHINDRISTAISVLEGELKDNVDILIRSLRDVKFNVGDELKDENMDYHRVVDTHRRNLQLLKIITSQLTSCAQTESHFGILTASFVCSEESPIVASAASSATLSSEAASKKEESMPKRVKVT